MRTTIIGLALFLTGVFFAGCNKGTGIGAVEVEPPVTAATPAGLKARAAHPRADSNIDLIRQRFFADGPTYIKSILESIDNRMAELDTRAKETTRPCLSETPTSFTVTSPFDLGITHYLSCLDNISSTQWLAFGQKDSTWYLREGQYTGSINLAKIDSSSNVEAWIAVANRSNPNSGSQMLMHLKSTSASGKLELAVTGTNIGVGCGVQMQSNSSYIYAAGKMDDSSGGSGANCASVSTTTVCADATTLNAVAGSNCTSAGLDTFSLTAIDYSTHPYANIYLFGDQSVSGISTF